MRHVVLIFANLVVLAAGLWVSQRSDFGSSFPSRPIRLIVPFGAGGGTDTFARVMDKAIRDNNLLPVPLVIINQGGAGGTIGSRRTKDARPDGYTIMILHEAILSAKAAGIAPYGPEAFAPVAATGEIETVIAVAEDAPWKSLDELLLSASADPDTLRFAANMGALSHFVGLQLETLKTGVAFRFAQFGGGAERLSALLGGHVDLSGFTVEEYVKFQPKGLRAIAVFGEERHPAIPDIPTAIEQGFPFVNTNTFFWWVPRGTDRARIDFLADLLEKTMQSEYVSQKLRETHFHPVFLRDAPLAARIAQAGQQFEKVKIPQDDVMPDVTLITCGMCLCLGLVAVWQFMKNRNTADTAAIKPPSDTAGFTPAIGRTVICLGLTILYVAVLSLGRVDFRIATIAFVALAVLVLVERKLQTFPKIALLAQSAGFGLHYVFTQLLVIDLP